jgi:hypothetical protein
MKRALSLASLSLVKYGMTWYQYNFNAYIDPSTKNINNFNKGLAKLKTFVDIPFDAFVRRNRLTDEQRSFLESLYEKCYDKISWLAFFQTIPTKKHCDIYFNWLPTFIDEYIMNGEFYINRVNWIIDLGEEGELSNSVTESMYDRIMVRTDMYILTDSNEIEAWKGGNRNTRRTQETRRNRYIPRNEWKVLSFSNDVLPPRR